MIEIEVWQFCAGIAVAFVIGYFTCYFIGRNDA